ncbi:hypothetical protein [Nocardioides guangzhouensis]|nr:hypothetical protein [Nocardioides guangzhouensis]
MLLPDILAGKIGPGAVFDQTVDIDGAPHRQGRPSRAVLTGWLPVGR